VLFLSADTGGGHRASAESLAKQFQIHYPGSTYELLDIWTEHGTIPYKTLVNAYKHLSAHPRQWRFLYHLSNSRPWELAMDWHSAFMCEKRIRQRIQNINPDVIVSVHPAMQNVPLISTRKISKRTGKHLPFFTVVTDLGSGHCTWFQKNPEKLYVASDRLYRLAKRRGRTPDSNIVMTGLPIRNDFAVEAQKLGDRTTAAGKEYQTVVKQKLGLADTSKPMVLVMGGGEGVGSLSDIVDELYTAMTRHGVDATICVVCGRNEKLQKQLAQRDWDAVINSKDHSLKPRRITRLFRWLFRRRRTGVAPTPEIEADFERAVQHHDDVAATPGKVTVVGLGFVTNMAEYMVAADILVTKAGPGTIAEAAAVGLPIMLTSFLPGQEAGNVDFVLENGFGDFRQDPVEIGEEVGMWLKDESLLHSMSHKAREAGHPSAASDIVIDIGSITHTWMALNGGSNRIEDIQESRGDI
jgi:1,2-diacylglycerol 3-beta-galactosyltransferase